MKKTMMISLVGLMVFLGACATGWGVLNCPSGETGYESSLSSLTVGGLEFTFSTPEICGTSPYSFSVTDGTCTLQLPAPFDQESIDLSGATVEWDETDAGVVSGGKFSWADDEMLITLKGIEFSITEAEFSEASSSGTIKLKAEVSEETVIKDIIYIQPAQLGDVTITFDGNGTFTFDYSALTGLEMKLKADAGTTEIATVSIASVSQAGVITDICLTALPDVDFKSAGFTASLDSLSVTFDYDIPNKNITYRSGAGVIKLKNIEGVQGDVSLGLTFTETEVKAELSTESTLKAFGFDIEGEGVSCEFNYDFELTKIAGTNIDISRADNDKFVLKGVSFELTDGKITAFSCASSTVKHKNIEFAISELTYLPDETEIQFNALLKLPSTEMTVNNFRINNDAEIKVESITLAMNQAPLTIGGTATFTDTEFSLIDADITFAGTGINADIIVGATETFNYGYARLKILSATGVVIPGSPIKIVTLSGAGGYNYTVDEFGNGDASEGALQIGFGMGISDLANKFTLTGEVGGRTMGGDVSLFIRGSVAAPATGDPYFSGDVTCAYWVGEEELIGALSTTITVPPSSGDIVQIDSGDGVNFTFKSGGEWGVSTVSEISGQLFSVVDWSLKYYL